MEDLEPCRRCGRTPALIPYEESADGNHDRPAKVVCPCGNRHLMTWGEFSHAMESVPPEKRGSGCMSRDEIDAISAVVVEAWNGEQSAGAETNLLPCPFCGSDAELVRNSSGSYFARCTNRQCAAKTRLYHENENGACLAWNRRSERTCCMDDCNTHDTCIVNRELCNGDVVSMEFGYKQCSECGTYVFDCPTVRYCPSCGARVVCR